MLPVKKTAVGLTLVELIMVMSILTVLMGVGAMTYSNILRTNLNRSTAADFAELEQRIQTARRRDSAVLGNITLSWNTSASCNNANVQAGGCATALTTAWNRIAPNQNPVRDPWGSLYVIDENEKQPAAAPCTRDRLWSAGANRIFQNGTVDDVTYDVRSFFSGCQ